MHEADHVLTSVAKKLGKESNTFLDILIHL